MGLFTCRACQTTYVVTYHSEPSPREPRCEGCNEPLPDREGNEWLHYKRGAVIARFKDD